MSFDYIDIQSNCHDISIGLGAKGVAEFEESSSNCPHASVVEPIENNSVTMNLMG